MNLSKVKVHEVGATVQVSESFKKRDLIVEYAENPTYPEYIKLEVHQDKTALLDTVKVGDELDIDFNLRGRPWTNKEGVTQYFNSLVMWKFKKLSEATAAAATPSYQAPVDISADDDDDDLPF